MKRKMRVAQVFVDNDEFCAKLGLPADTKILSVDGLNVPLGFFVMLVECEDLPRREVGHNLASETVTLESLQKMAEA